MLKRFRKERAVKPAVEPKEAVYYKKNKPNTGMEPKETTRYNILIFLVLLFVLIVVFCTLDANQNKVLAAPESNIFLPGEIETTPVQTQEDSKKNVDILWQGFHERVLNKEDKISIWLEQVDADIDPNAVATLMTIESCGHKHATSNSGAMGLFQVMPFHWENLDQKEEYYAYRPGVNARKGLAYFKKALKKANNDYYLAFAYYNGGLYIDPDKPNSWEAETRRYANWGSGIMNDINSGLKKSPTLQEWLKEGGASMCQDDFQTDIRIKIFGD